MAVKKRAKTVDPADCERTAARIVTAATRLFAQKGYDGTSTKEICAAAGVNIAAVHYHFKTKQRLYTHLIESFGGFRLQAVERILTKPETRDELKVRLELFLNEWIDAWVKEPDVCRIVQTEAESLRNGSERIFRTTFLKVFETLVGFFTSAKKSGLVRADLDPRIAARGLFSMLVHQTRTDNITAKFYKFSLRDESFRKTWIDQTLKIFLCGTCVSK